MYILSFNINQKDKADIRVLTEFPTILINENLNEILYQIRVIIKSHFQSMSVMYNVPLVDFRFGVSLIYKKGEFTTMHSFSLNLANIRETKELIKTKNENI